VRKGLGVAAKLRDLLGLGGFAAKPTPPPPPPQENVGSSGAMPTALPRSLDIIPVGDDVDARPRSKAWPTPQPPANTAAASRLLPRAPGARRPRHRSRRPLRERRRCEHAAAEPGMSVVMSRPTTLRGNIGKVSIESIFSPEFRGGAEGAAERASPRRRPRVARQLSIVPPLAGDPEFNVDPAPRGAARGADAPAASEPVAETPPSAHASDPNAPREESDEEAAQDTPTSRADSAELARATEDFMRSSPVLGATGRKVQRAPHEPAGHGFTDPDAIAIISIVDELTTLGVPVTRQSETRARLLTSRAPRRDQRARLERDSQEGGVVLDGVSGSRRRADAAATALDRPGRVRRSATPRIAVLPSASQVAKVRHRGSRSVPP
jgi:hypothetical protein